MGKAYNLEGQPPYVKKLNTEILYERDASNLGGQLSS